ncbi:MAG: hypothetical protein EOM20_21665 [Spartobacteria bacterium]|nr:hypothetical protein [Spartobacteria bacterium]
MIPDAEILCAHGPLFVEPPSARFAEIADAAKALHRIMGVRAGLTGIGTDAWSNYAIPNALKAAASRLAALLEAWIAESMGSVGAFNHAILKKTVK